MASQLVRCAVFVGAMIVGIHTSVVYASVHQPPAYTEAVRSHSSVSIDERIAQIRERVCQRLRSLSERTGRPLRLPPFCSSNPGGSAPTVTITATPDTILLGATTTLAWNSMNAVSCLASGSWSGTQVLQGTLSVAPAATSTYVLACANPFGTTTAQVTIGVTAPEESDGDPPVLTFTATPPTIFVGSSSVLVWNATDATSCIAGGAWNGTQSISGMATVSPTLTATYTLECININGTTTGVAAVTVLPVTVLVPTLSFSAQPESIMNGGTSTLAWSTTNATTCSASDGWSGLVATIGSVEVAPSATTTYTLTCSGPGGTTSPASVIVGVIQPSIPGTPRIVLSEVLYDPLSTTSAGNQGSETSNEWVEIYNAGTAPQTLSGWYIQDAASLDLLPTFILDPGAFAVITTSTTTQSFWSIPSGTQVIAIGGLIGNGLGNSGDYLALIGTGSTTIDAISWGSDTQAFTPAISDVPEGSSIARTAPSGIDSNAASDWAEDTTPAPGE
jgi:Lamin Tail Domain